MSQVSAAKEQPAKTAGSTRQDPLWVSYVVSVMAAWCAEFVTYPLDLTKTRLQLQGEIANKSDLKLATAPSRGMIATASGIIREEGLFKLWGGLSPMLLKHFVYSGTRMILYQYLRDEVFEKKPDEHFALWKTTLCGIGSGGTAQFLSSPADLLKVHMQMEGKRKLMGLPPRVTGLSDAFVKIVQTSGFKGLWKGAVPNVWRAALVTVGDVSGYDYSKRAILMNTSLKDNYVVHVLASFIAGFLAAILGTPADVIKTRIMNQPVGKGGRPLVYSSTLDCAIKSVRNEGFLSLYRGVVPFFWRLAPWSMTFWLSYEIILRGFGGTGW